MKSIQHFLVKGHTIPQHKKFKVFKHSSYKYMYVNIISINEFDALIKAGGYENSQDIKETREIILEDFAEGYFVFIRPGKDRIFYVDIATKDELDYSLTYITEITSNQFTNNYWVSNNWRND